MNIIELNRIGYGSNFNKLTIIDGKIINKECINNYGLMKINHEINFYKYLLENNIIFPVPKIFNFYKNGYSMEYLINYIPLYTVIYNFDLDKKKYILTKIKNILEKLHNSNKKNIIKEEYYKNINIEIECKIIDRIKNIMPIINKYNYIKTVNNIHILSFNFLLSWLKKRIINFIENKKELIFVPLHGDCQFNNILYNKDNDNLLFIDPRGYFGNSEIYGISEYDFAKVYFALSGYDEFDNRHINNLDIIDHNINIDINFIDDSIFNNYNLELLLTITLWMGNAHCFINNENKCIYSYYISLYLGTIVFNKYNDIK